MARMTIKAAVVRAYEQGYRSSKALADHVGTNRHNVTRIAREEGLVLERSKYDRRGAIELNGAARAKPTHQTEPRLKPVMFAQEHPDPLCAMLGDPHPDRSALAGRRGDGHP